MGYTQPEILNGTPYSLPAEASAALAEMSTRLRAARAGLHSALEDAAAQGLVRELARSHEYWTVYESNSIEFEGPDLAGTVKAIESTQGQRVLRDLSVNLLPSVLRSDRRAYAAIGLEAARLIALRFIGGDRRGVTQSDVRDLHSVIMAGEWHAGDYRQYPAGIEDALHKPFPTFMIRPAMTELADWTAQPVSDDDAVLRAAVGHAWFTHIHPFQDGNGRVGRLLANVLLGQDGLPPAIVKARSQRSSYIAALAHSDEAGDILPLAGLFLDTLERYVSELQNPRTFQRMFRDLVAGRGDSYFDFYVASFMEFFRRLRTELALTGLEMVSLDKLSREVFGDTRRADGGPRDGRKNVTVALITDSLGRELSVYVHTPSTKLQRVVPREESVPSISFAVPGEFYSLDLHRRLRSDELGGLKSFWIQPGRPVKVHCETERRTTEHSASQGVSIIAEHIRKGFAQGFQMPDSGGRIRSYVERL